MTTIKLGVTRYGPLAPDTCQLGKYDTLTSTGTPIVSTSNDTLSSPLWMLVTWTGWSEVRGGFKSVEGIRAQFFGPLAA